MLLFSGKNRLHESAKYDVWMYVVLISISSLAALLAVKNIIITPDSMTYGLVSQQILSGNGIKVPMIWLDSTAVPVDGSVPLLIHPPLLPILLALLGGVTPQSFLAAQMLNVICHVVLSVFTFLVMKIVYDKWIALLTGILVSLSFPLLKVAHHASSETLFIALTTGSLYFLMTSRHCSGRTYTWKLLLSSIFASAAIMTRNAGVAIIAVFLWEALIVIKNRKSRHYLGSVIAAIAMPVMTVAALFTRNYLIAGMIRGYNQPPIERSCTSAVIGTLDMLFSQFQLGTRSMALIAVLIILFICYAVRKSRLRRELVKSWDAGINSMVVFTVSYAALICYAMAHKQPRFEIRFMAPLVPYLFVITVSLIVIVWKTTSYQRFSRFPYAGMILSLSILAFANGYKTFLNLPYFFYKHNKVYAIQDSCLFKWINENYSKDVLITTNKSYHLSFFGGYSTLILPHRRWAPNTRIPEDMESFLLQRMVETGSQVLVLFNEPEIDYYGSYIAGLFHKKQPNQKLSLVYACSGGVIYRVNQ